MTNETEVLRIEGNVTVPKGTDTNLIRSMILSVAHTWEGNIVPQDSPTGMRLYRVEDIEKIKAERDGYQKGCEQLFETKAENDKAFLSLSEELTRQKGNYDILKRLYDNSRDTIDRKSDEITALKKRIELAENTRWRTFIKWLGIWN